MDTVEPESGVARQLPPWMFGPICDLADDDLDRAAHAAFEWWRLRPRGGPIRPEVTERLAALQREFLRRFPEGDLSRARSRP
jgi:hypothetical protein